MTRNQFKKMIKETWEQEAKEVCKSMEDKEDTKIIDKMVKISRKTNK